MKLFPSSYSLFFFSACISLAQPASKLPKSSGDNVEVQTKLSAVDIPVGSSFQIAAVLRIADKWHINSHRPLTDYLLPTNLELQPKEGVIVSEIRYPEGKRVRLSFSDQPLDVYEGTVTIFVSARVSGKARTGQDTIMAILRVQSCNDQICLAPSTMHVAIPVTFVSLDRGSTPANQEYFRTFTPAQPGTQSPDNELASLIEQRGWLVSFLVIFTIGLALNLTPCVYPMLSVTVSLFGTQTETGTVRVFFKALVYVLGMATMYSVLGVSAALSGGLFGSWLQSSWVLGVIGVLLLALSLSSFGLYQIQAPYWMTSRLGGATGTGLVSLYLSGLVVGVFAAPCIGPPVVALLTLVASRGDPVFGFLSFFVLSVGLGFPYLLLGTFSGLLKRIPRSGPWLVWVERIFGVILAAAALFYFALAVAPTYAAYVVPAALLLGGIYLGFVEPSGKNTNGLRQFKWLAGTVAVIFGIVAANALHEQGVQWDRYSEDKLAEAKNSGKPVVIDFYADWCIPCLELDRKTFTDREVMNATRAFVRMKVDLTHFDSPDAEALRKQYGIAGVPTVVFLRPGGQEEPRTRFEGYVPPSEFLDKVKIVQTPG